MKVEKYEVFRIVPFDDDIEIGDLVNPSKWEVIGERKKIIEDSLESNRPKNFPKRDKCLYVCFSKKNACEWARIKYCKRNMPYKLLTLEITGELYWFKADCYHFLGEEFTHEQLEEACEDYWNSMTENRNNLILDKGYEGLFVGDAIVKAIEYKNYINGESKDIE